MLRMKRILIVGMSSNLGGVECFIMNYFRVLSKMNLQFDFLIFEDHCMFEEEIIKNGGSIFKIMQPRFKNYLAFRRDREKFFSEHSKNYDAIWMNDCSLANAGDLAVAKRYGVKCRIFHSHNSQHMRKDIKKYFYAALHYVNKLRIGKMANCFWACSDDAGKFCFGDSLMSNENYSVIPNAIDIELFRYNKGVRTEYRKQLGIENNIVIGNVGRLHFQKNQVFLIKVFKHLIDKVPNAVLLLIGEGEERVNIEKAINETGLTDKVKMLGLRNDISNLMQAMDSFVLTSVFEGLGIVLVEAQAAGLRSFASKDVIPACVKICDLLEFISLEESAESWARMIANSIVYERTDVYSELSNTEYNLPVAAKILFTFFDAI